MRIPNHRVWCQLGWLALALSMPPAACQAQATSAAPPDSGAASGRSGSAPPALSAECQQLARILGVDQDCANLAALSQAKEQAASPETSLEILKYREQITEAVVLASLDADTALGQIGAEQNQVAELRSLLRARRDRALGNTNLAVLATATGLGIVGGLLQFSESTSDAGNGVAIASGAVSSLFTLRTFHQIHRSKRPQWTLPTLLGPFLVDAGGKPDGFPDDVWTYLNTAPPDAVPPRTRLLAMLDAWTAAGRLGVAGSPQSKRTIVLLTTPNADEKKLDIDLLNEREAMLADVQAKIAGMKHGLASLMQWLKQF
ncbi:MAG TPA: hypothetical protein VGS20_02385 [Candidatus Acidoferrales bacterium]|nr:hypothetical protein [Candidatus Acidoferrales bacterium]